MACRRVLGAALIALTLGGTAACGATVQVFSTAKPSASSTATAPSATVLAERNAVARLQDWLAAPQAGTLTYNAVQVTNGGAINVMSILSGPFGPVARQATLTGSIDTLGSGSTTQGPSSAVEYGGKVYTSIPAALQTGDRVGKQWQAAPVDAAWGSGAADSGWWTALSSVKQVQADGLTSLAGSTVDMFSAFLDLSAIKGVPKALLAADPVKKAGTAKVEVDVYTALGSGKLMRVTYKLGLPVQIDAAATAKSTAGYEVDLTGFGEASASATPAPTGTATPAAPDPATVAKDTGDTDLAALLPF